MKLLSHHCFHFVHSDDNENEEMGLTMNYLPKRTSIAVQVGSSMEQKFAIDDKTDMATKEHEQKEDIKVLKQYNDFCKVMSSFKIHFFIFYLMLYVNFDVAQFV